MAQPMKVLVADDAGTGPPVEIRVVVEGYGVALSLLNAHGYEVGRVALDYHDNKLKALVYDEDNDDPRDTICLCDDVRDAFTKHPRYDPEEQPPPPKQEPEPGPAVPTYRWGRSHGMKTWHVVVDEPIRQHPNATEGVDRHIYACTTACGRTEYIFSKGAIFEGTERPAYSPGESSVCPDCVRWVEEKVKEATAK